MPSDDTAVISAVVMIVRAILAAVLTTAHAVATTGVVPVDDLGGGRAELLYPPWVKGASWFPGMLGVNGAWARPTPEGYLRRERRRPLESITTTARA